MGHKHKHRSHNKMSTLEEMDNLLSAPDYPINPVNGSRDWILAASKPNSPNYKGYKYYEKVRESLPEWWEEFNGDLDSHGRLKYVTIRAFIKSKTSKKEEQHYLYQMLGPVKKHDKQEAPWLGDWEKRRRNGFGLLDNREKIKPLLKIIKENLAAADSIKALAPFLADELVQYSNLQNQVHEAFASRAFLNGKDANDKKNIARFDCYRVMLAGLTEIKFKVIREIMRIHGVDPDTPQQMREMVAMAGGIGAAAALTGIAASQGAQLSLPPGFGGNVNTPNGPVIAPYTYDALKLAEHLTKHAHTFNKPLPPTIEADPSDLEDKPKHKGNGKVV